MISNDDYDDDFLCFRGILTVMGGWREDIEKRIGEHEIVLSDLESRQVLIIYNYFAGK